LELHVILLTDSELLAINRASLGHDWLTDIITFEIECTVQTIEAEIYISVDRARENARRFRVPLMQELEHLIIHGMLHLAGMTDKTALEKKQMRARERLFLAKLKSPHRA
jgi:probable rRNA maturation factor